MASKWEVGRIACNVGFNNQRSERSAWACKYVDVCARGHGCEKRLGAHPACVVLTAHGLWGGGQAATSSLRAGSYRRRRRSRMSRSCPLIRPSNRSTC